MLYPIPTCLRRPGSSHIRCKIARRMTRFSPQMSVKLCRSPVRIRQKPFKRERTRHELRAVQLPIYRMCEFLKAQFNPGAFEQWRLDIFLGASAGQIVRARYGFCLDPFVELHEAHQKSSHSPCALLKF